MDNLFSQNNLLTFFAIVAGVVSLIELLEYLVTKNIPWLLRSVHLFWKRVKYRFRGDEGMEGRYVVLNFSGHPVLPGQLEALEKMMLWHASVVIDVPVGTIKEDRMFVANIVRTIDKIDLSPEQWQTAGIVTIPAGYSAIWSVVLAELHGRLGYFPDVVHLRPAPSDAEEKYEVAEIMNLREVRHASREKR
jgi:hypothetical protein